MLVLPLIDPDRAAAARCRSALRSLCEEFFAKLRAQLVARLRSSKVAKAGKDDWDDLRDSASDDAGWSGLHDHVRPELERMAKDGAQQALRQVEQETFQLLYQANVDAVRWAQDRAGTLIEDLSSTTKARLRDIIAQALRDGLSNDDLADALEESFWFSGARAEVIARTETTIADVKGNVIGWKRSGVVAGKEWAYSHEENACERCEALDGEIVPLDEEFPDGDPPLHPNCACALLPVLAESEQAQPAAQEQGGVVPARAAAAGQD